MAALEATHGAQRRAPEDTVVGEVQRALELAHLTTTIAVVQCGQRLGVGSEERAGSQDGRQAGDVRGAGDGRRRYQRKSLLFA